MPSVSSLTFDFLPFQIRMFLCSISKQYIAGFLFLFLLETNRIYQFQLLSGNLWPFICIIINDKYWSILTCMSLFSVFFNLTCSLLCLYPLPFLHPKFSISLFSYSSFPHANLEVIRYFCSFRNYYWNFVMHTQQINIKALEYSTPITHS